MATSSPPTKSKHPTSEVLADIDSKIGPDNKAGYDAMAKRIDDVQKALLEHLSKADSPV